MGRSRPADSISEVRVEKGMRPSEVFGANLRETRKDRRLSQAELAEWMTEAGRPMSRAAVIGVENGTRGLSLDEALALAELLDAAPATLLGPVAEKYIFVTDWVGFDGEALRSWLRWGWHMAEEKGYGPPTDLERSIVMQARLIADAERMKNWAALADATRRLREMVREAEEGES